MRGLTVCILSILFSSYNQQVYGKHIAVPKTMLPKFIQVERMLTHAEVELEDFALTTFTDRIWIAQKIGHLPANIFLSKQSIENYVKRIEQGCEVTKKKNTKRNLEGLTAKERQELIKYESQNEEWLKWCESEEGKKVLAAIESGEIAVEYRGKAEHEAQKRKESGWQRVKDEHEADENIG